MTKLPDSYYRAEQAWLDTPSQNGDDCLICHVCGEEIEEEFVDDSGRDLCEECYRLFLEENESEEED